MLKNGWLAKILFLNRAVNRTLPIFPFSKFKKQLAHAVYVSSKTAPLVRIYLCSYLYTFSH